MIEMVLVQQLGGRQAPADTALSFLRDRASQTDNSSPADSRALSMLIVLLPVSVRKVFREER